MNLNGSPTCLLRFCCNVSRSVSVQDMGDEFTLPDCFIIFCSCNRRNLWYERILSTLLKILFQLKSVSQ